MTRPRRVQRRRTKGYRHPPNTRFVGRRGPFGNPFRVGDRLPDGRVISDELAVQCYRVWVFKTGLDRRIRRELRGVNVSCYCREGDPCHADVVLEIAND